MIRWLALVILALSFLLWVVSGDLDQGSGDHKEDLLVHGVDHLAHGDQDHLSLQT